MNQAVTAPPAHMASQGKIFAQMAAAMKKIEPISKDRAGAEGKYKFRGVDDVYNAVQPILAEAGIFTTSEVLEQKEKEYAVASGAKWAEIQLKIRWYFWADDGSFVTHTTIGIGRDNSDKAANKAMAVSHKYAVMQALMIPTDDPKDPENDHLEAKAEKPAAAAKPAPKFAPAKAQGSESAPAAPAPKATKGNSGADAMKSKALRDEILASVGISETKETVTACWKFVQTREQELLPVDVEMVRVGCTKRNEYLKAQAGPASAPASPAAPAPAAAAN